MDVDNFLEKKEIEIMGKKFLISKMPAIQGQQAFGAVMREVGIDGDIAMTFLSIPTGLMLTEYAAYKDGDSWVPLDSEFVVDSACGSIKQLQLLHAELIRYNFDFLFDGSLQKLLGALTPKAPTSEDTSKPQ